MTRRAAAGSVVFAAARGTAGRARSLATTVTTASLPRPLERAVERSTVVGLEREVEAAVRDSFIYRWFTTEPGGDPILIDLRDTYTVGPVIAALDRLEESVDQIRQSSTAGIARMTYATLAWAGARSWTCRALSKFFAPPDPPEERHGRE